MNIEEVKIDFDDKNRSRLESRVYTTDHTDIPNTAIPQAMWENLCIIFKTLTGEELDRNDYIYTVQSKDGIFRKLYVPYIYTADNKLILAFGSKEAELNTSGIKYAFIETQINGFKTLCLKVTIAQKDKIVLTSIPIRTKDYKNPPDADKLEILLSTGQTDEFFSLIGGKPSSGSGNFLRGPLVSLSQLGINQIFTVTESQWNNRGKFPSLHLQTSTEIPFTATVPIANDDGTYSKEVREIVGEFRIKGNTSLKKFINSQPKYPFSFKILSIGEFNGFPVAKLEIIAENGFEVDEEDLSLDF